MTKSNWCGLFLGAFLLLTFLHGQVLELYVSLVSSGPVTLSVDSWLGEFTRERAWVWLAWLKWLQGAALVVLGIAWLFGRPAEE